MSFADKLKQIMDDGGVSHTVKQIAPGVTYFKLHKPITMRVPYNQRRPPGSDEPIKELAEEMAADFKRQIDDEMKGR